jgi:ABC-type lipoprotein export system ATPase subunit
MRVLADAPSAWPGAPVLELRGVTKTFGRGPDAITVLDAIDLRVREGEVVVLTGSSGSGKTTLLNVLAGLDRPSSGRVVLAGRRVGMVSQLFSLVPVLDALENVELALHPLALSRRERRERALRALDRVGLGHRPRHRPRQLCADENQRLAVARAVAAEPQVLLADEPTAHLEDVSAGRMLALLGRLNEESGTTLVLATRNGGALARADRRLHLAGGALSPWPVSA